jgi:ABC-2 type transport system ATP-binding protein
MNDIPILQTHNLGKRFRKRWAVRSLNLTVMRGDVFGFLGPNGAGKSTTIRMLLSLIRPTEGSVTLFGRQLTKARAEVLQRVGGLVERADFYLYLPARKNLEIVGALRGGTTMKEIDEALDIVGLLDRAEERVKTYSHGMKQRLGIAQALLGGPEFIVLDEPTTGLDPQGIKEVRELIQRLREERGMTVFLSSHLLSEIEQTATSMAIINRGSLVVQGQVQDLLDEQDRVVRFDAEPADRARELLAALPFVRDLKRDGEFFECTIPRENIAETNRVLVQGGVDVRALLPKRSLEEFFLAITEGASEISPHRQRHRTTEDPA